MKIFVSNLLLEAHIVSHLLQQEKIQCEVRGEGLFGLQGELPFGEETNPYVWLFDAHKEREALAVIETYRDNHEQNVSNWYCQKCGEENEPQFSACWHCSSVQ
ncbi:RanBP2-type domain-containing protein [Vibrio aestuarianus]|nr:RanBP2-type domain-containing protein [Vibrio aestuarianus]